MFPRSLTVVLSALCCLLLLGCEESVDAVLEGDQGFTMYGFLNPRADTQAVRIFPIAPLLTDLIDGPIDAVVTSTDLVTGETVAWSDSIVTYASGSSGYVAFAPFRVEYGRSYRLDVRRSDGTTTNVIVPVPEHVVEDRLEPFTRRFPDRILPAPFLPYEFDGDVRLIQPRATYSVEALGVGTFDVQVSYDGQETMTGDGWRLEVHMARDQDFIRERLVRDGWIAPTAQLELRWIAVSAMVVNPEWRPPGGVFDLELLAQPGAWDNVEGGFGFVGGGYVVEFGLLPSGCFQNWAGFTSLCTPDAEE